MKHRRLSTFIALSIIILICAGVSFLSHRDETASTYPRAKLAKPLVATLSAFVLSQNPKTTKSLREAFCLWPVTPSNTHEPGAVFYSCIPELRTALVREYFGIYKNGSAVEQIQTVGAPLTCIPLEAFTSQLLTLLPESANSPEFDPNTITADYLGDHDTVTLRLRFLGGCFVDLYIRLGEKKP
jgi:hypothetical protein